MTTETLLVTFNSFGENAASLFLVPKNSLIGDLIKDVKEWYASTDCKILDNEEITLSEEKIEDMSLFLDIFCSYDIYLPIGSELKFSTEDEFLNYFKEKSRYFKKDYYTGDDKILIEKYVKELYNFDMVRNDKPITGLIIMKHVSLGFRP